MAFLIRTVREIEREVLRRGNRKWWALFLHAKYDKEKVQGWKLDFQKILGVFNVRCPALFTRNMVFEEHSRQRLV